jgi:hypothetical protein
MAKKWYRNNNPKNKYSFKSGKIAAGGVGEIEESEISVRLLEKKQLTEIDAPQVGGAEEEVNAPAPNAPNAPDADANADADADKGGDEDKEWTIEEAAAKLVAEPDLLDDDEDFTAGGVPQVDALAVVFARDFSAAERNTLWDRVLELKAEAAE